MEKESQREGPQNNKTVVAKTVAENILIPKHRFDCVNLCLKETKQALRNKTDEAERNKIEVAEFKKMLLDAKIETALALHRAKNLTAAKALIDCSDLKLEQDGDVPGLEEKILNVKKSQNYLFESQENTTYVLVPVRDGDPLNKSITDYINGEKR